MHTDNIQIQKISNYFQSVPKRSLSYNDLKKKRLLRSEKSKTKLNSHHTPNSKLIIQTEKKKTPQNFSIAISASSKTNYEINKIQKSISQLKDVFQEMKSKSKSKKYIISKPFYTDRIIENKKISFIEKSIAENSKINALYESVDLVGNQKQLIKRIIQKKKSQRRLIKFDQVRAQLKRSKSKSKLNIVQEDTTANSHVVKSSSKQMMQRSRSRKNLRINKFETVKQKPITISVTQRPNSSTNVVKKYPTVQIISKESLGLKSQYQSRRKLKIEDFKTERVEIQKKQKGQSELKLKFHRKLRKTNSEIVIKTKQLVYGNNRNEVPSDNNKNEQTYDKSKYMGRIEHKSIIIKSASKENQYFTTNGENSQIQRSFNKENNQQYSKTQILNQPQNKRQPQNTPTQMHLLKDLQLSDINISEIQLRREPSFNDIENQLHIIQAIEAQQLQIKMKKVKPSELQLQQNNNKFKKSLKSHSKKHQLNCSKIQNAQNLQSLSNILDNIALPTKQLKVKINSCSTKIVKKKNELQKFKKIFPTNFFNN